ncbi:MAG: MFS transporter [Candidatus Hodarchaeales archaeon]
MERKVELITVFTIMFTEILGFSLVLPFLAYFATDLGASPMIVGLIFTTFSLCQFISSPIIGKLSDKFGRRPLLLISQMSTVIGFLILAFANTLELIFLSRIVDGLLGSNLTITRAYLGDITEGKDQRKIFGYGGAVFGIGFFIGPAIGGFLATINYSIPSLLAALISALTVLLIVFFLKETVVKEKDVSFELEDFVPVREIVHVFNSDVFRIIFITYLCFVLAHTLLTSNLSLFADYQLQVGPEIVGLYLMFVGFLRIVFQIIIFPRLINAFNSVSLLIIGLSSFLVAFIGILFVESALIMFLILGTFSIGSGIIRPTLTSEISRKSTIKTRGKYMGVADSLQSLSQIITPLIGGYIIEDFVPGFIGLVAVVIILPTVLIVLVKMKDQPPSENVLQKTV